MLREYKNYINIFLFKLISYLLQNMADLKAIIKKHFEPIFKAYDKDQSSTLEKDELRALLADNLGVS